MNYNITKKNFSYLKKLFKLFNKKIILLYCTLIISSVLYSELVLIIKQYLYKKLIKPCMHQVQIQGAKVRASNFCLWCIKVFI